MNRFEIAAQKIEKQYGVGVEYNPASLAHPYAVEHFGCTDIRDARRLAKKIAAEAARSIGGFQTQKKYA